MPTEYRLRYTGAEINRKLAQVDVNKENIDKLSGTVEITSANPTKKSTVLTIDPKADEVSVYSAYEVDDMTGALDEKTELLQQQVNVERGRIDQYLTPDKGDVTGNEELEDLRVGTDGVVYQTAGTGVRTSIDKVPRMKVSASTPIAENVNLWVKTVEGEEHIIPEIKDDEVSDGDTWSSKKIDEEVSKLSNEIDDIEADINNDLYIGGYDDITSDFTIVTGYYATEQGNITSWENGSYSELKKVKSGDKFRISGCRNNTNCPIVVFYTSSTVADRTTFHSFEGGTDEFESGTVVADYEVTVPSGVCGMIINSAYYTYYTRKVEKYDCRKEMKKDTFELENLERRVLKAEKGNDFAWGEFDKSYFIFIHDDLGSFIETAYNAFHSKGVPFSSAVITDNLDKVYGSHTAKEWLDLMVVDGGEVLAHWSGNLLNTTSNEEWYEKFVKPKKILTELGFNVRGAILADSSDRQSEKGEKFCRKYYDYADKVGISTQYYLDRSLMLNFIDLDAFKRRIDENAQTSGIYLFGFHGNRSDETWITEDSLKEIIDYINAKSNCEITTIDNVFDSIGSTVLEQRIIALENN